MATVGEAATGATSKAEEILFKDIEEIHEEEVEVEVVEEITGVVQPAMQVCKPRVTDHSI